MKRLILYLIGIVLTSFGLFLVILNLNLLTMGYSFLKYVKFIISDVYCYSLFIGLILLGILMKGATK